jgi:hypothetical protein
MFWAMLAGRAGLVMEIDRNLTLLQALAMAGRSNRISAVGGSRLLRKAAADNEVYK